MTTDTTLLRRDVLRTWSPPPRLTLSEWADQYRRLSPEASAEPGQWDTNRVPYMRGMLDAVSDRRNRRVVFKTASQVGKTEILLNCIGYHIAQDPAPMLLIMPTLEIGQTTSKDRIGPMLRDTPCLRGKVQDPRARDSSTTILHKTFSGGHLTIAGANSPANLASRPIRVVLLDEVDRFPASAGPEGDAAKLAEKRTATFHNSCIVMASTPTLKDASRIEHAYQQSDMRRYWVPCPHCGTFQVLTWAGVKWDEGRPDTARYCCHDCGTLIEERYKMKMLMAGEWRADRPFAGVAGFHVSELYSPWRRWSDVAEDFLEAKHGGSALLQVWTNTSLGEVWDGDGGEGIEGIGLMARLEQYEPEELQTLAITAGVDVQRDRLECSLVGWGAGEEAWLLDHVVLPGDTAQAEVWGELADLFREHQLTAAAIDSGFNTSQVYAFCSRLRYCFPIKGASGMNRPFTEDARKRAQRLRRAKKGIVVELLGVDGGKVLIHSRLRLTTAGPGFIHFPDSPAFDDEYFQQLGAERLVTRFRFGQQKVEWQQTRPRNEALDCLTYSLGALRLWGGLDKAVARQAQIEAAQEDGDPLPEQRPAIRRWKIQRNERFRTY